VAVVFKQHRFSFGDSCIAVAEAGDESYPMLFFLHGRFGQGDMWRPVVEILSSQFRCLVVDFPGYGASFSARGRTWSLLENTLLVAKLTEEFRRPDQKVFLVGQDVGAYPSIPARAGADEFRERLRAARDLKLAGAMEPLARATKTIFVQARASFFFRARAASRFLVSFGKSTRGKLAGR
jgi:pimeloyl-ACP methyl ester carboxylesterase